MDIKLETQETGGYRNKAKIYVGLLSLNEAIARKSMDLPSGKTKNQFCLILCWKKNKKKKEYLKV